MVNYLFILFSFLTLNLNATTYYVDGVAGNDGNDGLTTITPLKTISALIGKGITASDIINLKCNSHFREQLTIIVNNVTIQSYGIGIRPILDASDSLGASVWSKSGGYTNIYQASITLAQIITIYTNCWENGTVYTRASSMVNCDATAGTYYLSEVITSTTLYIHPFGSTNPTVDGKTYEVSIRNYGLVAETTSGTVVINIWTKKNLSENGSFFVGTNSTVTGCRASWGNKHNMFIKGGSTVTNCVIDDAYYGSGSVIMVVYYETTGVGTDITFTGDTCKSINGLITGSGFGGHTSGGNFGTITFNSCVVSNLGVNASGFNAGYANLVIANSCTTDIATGNGYAVTSPIQINSSYIGALTIGVSISSANTSVIVNNSTMVMGNGSVPSCIRSLVNGSVVTITCCTITDGYGWMFQLTGSGVVFKAYRNNYVAGNSGWYDITTAGWDVKSDFNSFLQTKNFRIEGLIKTLAEWKTLSGQDLHSNP